MFSSYSIVLGVDRAVVPVGKFGAVGVVLASCREFGEVFGNEHNLRTYFAERRRVGFCGECLEFGVKGGWGFLCVAQSRHCGCRCDNRK